MDQFMLDDYLLVMRYIAYYVGQYGVSDDLVRLASCVVSTAKDCYLDHVEAGEIPF